MGDERTNEIVVGRDCAVKQVYVEGGFTWCGKHQRPIGECEADYLRAENRELRAALEAFVCKPNGNCGSEKCKKGQAALARREG